MDTRKKVLVVDDEEQVLFVVGDGLKKLGDAYEIVTVQDPLDAADLLRQMPFALMITDLKMPGMDGIALTEVGRALQPMMKIMWMTAYQWRDADAERLGVVRCMNKPLEVNEIRTAALQVLEGISSPVARTGKQILIVEDSPQEAIVLYQALGAVQGGYQVKITLLLDEALNSLRYERYDLILVGLHLGTSNELDFVQRAHRLSPRTRVVLLEPPSSMEAERKVVALGALHLTELTDLPDLMGVLRPALARLPRRQRILLLGEDDESRGLYFKALSRSGYEVYVNADVDEAGRFLKDYCFDLCIWNLPRAWSLQAVPAQRQVGILQRAGMAILLLAAEPGNESLPQVVVERKVAPGDLPALVQRILSGS